MSSELREKLRGEVQAVAASDLLPHHRRDALFMVEEGTDLLDVAVAIALDDKDQVSERIAAGQILRPTLAQLADWCVDLTLRFQFVILQPYVLAQRIIQVPEDLN